MTRAMTRRSLLGAGLGAVAAMLAAPIGAGASLRERFMIVNADDLGLSAEIDRGIFEAHDGGIVTSASVLVDGPDAEAAVQEARKRPKLGLGVHVAFDSRGKWLIDVQDLDAVQRELDRQLDAFARLTGRPPDHIDSHHHVHRRFNVARLFLDAGRRYGVPVRGFSDVVFVGRFYGQPEFGKTDLSKISVEYLVGLLRSLKPGVSEVSCHPGRPETRPDAIYNRERESELSTLTDVRVKAVIADEGLRLINYRDYARLRS
jgi:chitin disaccharide deacetylase